MIGRFREAAPSGFEAVIEIEFNNGSLRKAFVKALTPEVRLGLRGVRSELTAYERGVRLSIKAPDPSSFRAALNALLRLASLLLKVIEDLEPKIDPNNI